MQHKTKIIDQFSGWIVLDIQLLKDAIKQLPPHYRKFKTIRKETGLGPQQLSDYLSGKRFPNLTNFKKLCLYAQISADKLLGLSEVFIDNPDDFT